MENNVVGQTDVREFLSFRIHVLELRLRYGKIWANQLRKEVKRAFGDVVTNNSY